MILIREIVETVPDRQSASCRRLLGSFDDLAVLVEYHVGLGCLGADRAVLVDTL
jgi:hypothetical protein